MYFCVVLASAVFPEEMYQYLSICMHAEYAYYMNIGIF